MHGLNVCDTCGMILVVDRDRASYCRPAMKAQEKNQLLRTLQTRFEKHMRRHPGVSWASVQARISANAHALRSLHEMEETGGEPDVIGSQGEDGRYTFCACAAESPSGRRWPRRWASRSSRRMSTATCSPSASSI